MLNIQKVKRLRNQILRLQIKLCGNNHEWIILKRWEMVEQFGVTKYEDRKCSVCELEKTFEIR